ASQTGLCEQQDLPHWIRPVTLHFTLHSPDLIAGLSNHSTAPSGAAFRRTTTKITTHAMATSKRQPPTNMATRPGFSLTISPGRVGKISEVVAKTIPSLREPH